MRKLKPVYLFLPVAVCAFLYVAVRAFTVAITADEAWTFLTFAHKPVWDIITCEPPIANNHILNTLLMKLCSQFSDAEFSLRLPNLLALIIYLYAACKISRMYSKHTGISFGLYITLVGNYSLLTFFGLCRGYGLSIAFMLYAIWQLMQFAYQYKPQILHFCLASSVLSVYASFATLPADVAIIAISAMIMYKHAKTAGAVGLWKIIRWPAFYCSLLLVISAYPIYRMLTAGQLYYGGHTGFVRDTLFTISLDYFGYWLFDNLLMMSRILGLLILMITIMALVRICKKPGEYPLAIPVVTLLFCFCLVNFEFYTLHTKLPYARTALYLYPLIVLSLFYPLILLQQKFPKLAVSVSLAMGVISVINVSSEANLFATREWWDDAYTKDVIKQINNKMPPTGRSRKVRVLGMFSTAYPLTYYSENIAPGTIEPVSDIAITDTVNYNMFDYLFLSSALKKPAPDTFEIIAAYQDSTYLLFGKR